MNLFEVIIFLALIGFAWFLESYFKGHKSCMLALTKFVTYALIVLFSLAFIGKCSEAVWVDEEDKEEVNDPSNRPDDEIYTYAKNYVKENLKAPATAKFPQYWDERVKIYNMGGGEYRVYAYVDSQNSFGALIRTKFSCTVKVHEGGVTCTDLEFTE